MYSAPDKASTPSHPKNTSPGAPPPPSPPTHPHPPLSERNLARFVCKHACLGWGCGRAAVGRACGQRVRKPSSPGGAGVVGKRVCLKQKMKNAEEAPSAQSHTRKADSHARGQERSGLKGLGCAPGSAPEHFSDVYRPRSCSPPPGQGRRLLGRRLSRPFSALLSRPPSLAPALFEVAQYILDRWPSQE